MLKYFVKISAECVPFDFIKSEYLTYFSSSAYPYFRKSDIFWLYGLLALGFLSVLLVLKLLHLMGTLFLISYFLYRTGFCGSFFLSSCLPLTW